MGLSLGAARHGSAVAPTDRAPLGGLGGFQTFPRYPPTYRRPTGLAVEGLEDIAALYVTLSGEWLQRAKHPLVSWESTVSLD